MKFVVNVNVLNTKKNGKIEKNNKKTSKNSENKKKKKKKKNTSIRKTKRRANQE